ncbi:hypothetical protein [Acanthopleuribacter pedis]|uniref:Acyl carrier protein n=1 Tax=Acanthopleuribacter pedis TaxID=442870 RepID=A0A8J7Q2I8_9BACT|nr:hypothetical protein [Acanthopleuribacter pedis]MBO1319357.1 hypothetical protein [Acanthopleuribacter pedis]
MSLSVASKTRERIDSVLQSIQQQRGLPPVPLEEGHQVMADLGFASLDVAQLIALLEIELGVDPFAAGVSLQEVHTVGELYRVYQDACNKAAGQAP